MKPSFICILSASMLSLVFGSCQKDAYRFNFGDEVRFAIGSGSAETKAVYSGETTTDKSIERIDWEENDLIRIYSAEVSAPTDKFADYAVTSVDIPESGSAISTADIAAYGGEGLHWGTGSHTFYGVYPSPEEEGSITTDIKPYEPVELKSSVTKSISGATVTAYLTGSQAVFGGITGSTSKIAAPDMKNMLMTAKSAAYTPETGIPDGVVFLSFTPLTTAVQFTITNQTTAPLVLKSVSLTSAANPLNGQFSVNIDNAGIPASIDLDNDGNTTGANDIKYSRAYPECTYTGGAATDATRTVTINFTSPVTLAYNADPDQSGKLTFTFFLQPCQNFDDLTFKLVKDGGSWMQTRLGYTDGSGILFPRFKKTTVKGLFVPEGAQWTVKYGPAVEPWNQSGTGIDPMPEVNEGLTVVTSWDTGIEEELPLIYVDPYNGHEYVEIGGLKWATCNLGANTPKDYGWYFSWGGTTGYVRDGSWVTAQGGSELSGGFSWANAQYNTGGVNTTWNKYIPTGKTGYWTGGGSPDNKLSLELVDDAARANWGGSWRMPTQADFQTLYEACGGTGTSSNPPALPSANPGKGIYWVSNSQTYISDYNGVAGILFCDGTSKLFFVAAGYGVFGNFNDEGVSGRYWSGSVFSNPPCNAYYMSFISNNVKSDDANGRNQGFPVRPVSD